MAAPVRDRHHVADHANCQCRGSRSLVLRPRDAGRSLGSISLHPLYGRGTTPTRRCRQHRSVAVQASLSELTRNDFSTAWQLLVSPTVFGTEIARPPNHARGVGTEKRPKPAGSEPKKWQQNGDRKHLSCQNLEHSGKVQSRGTRNREGGCLSIKVRAVSAANWASWETVLPTRPLFFATSFCLDCCNLIQTGGDHSRPPRSVGLKALKVVANIALSVYPKTGYGELASD